MVFWTPYFKSRFDEFTKKIDIKLNILYKTFRWHLVNPLIRYVMRQVMSLWRASEFQPHQLFKLKSHP